MKQSNGLKKSLCIIVICSLASSLAAGGFLTREKEPEETKSLWDTYVSSASLNGTNALFSTSMLSSVYALTTNKTRAAELMTLSVLSYLWARNGHKGLKKKLGLIGMSIPIGYLLWNNWDTSTPKKSKKIDTATQITDHSNAIIETVCAIKGALEKDQLKTEENYTEAIIICYQLFLKSFLNGVTDDKIARVRFIWLTLTPLFEQYHIYLQDKPEEKEFMIMNTHNFPGLYIMNNTAIQMTPENTLFSVMLSMPNDHKKTGETLELETNNIEKAFLISELGKIGGYVEKIAAIFLETDKGKKAQEEKLQLMKGLLTGNIPGMSEAESKVLKDLMNNMFSSGNGLNKSPLLYGTCASCGTPGTVDHPVIPCEVCGKTFYCCNDHREKDKKAHKAVCKTLEGLE